MAATIHKLLKFIDDNEGKIDFSPLMADHNFFRKKVNRSEPIASEIKRIIKEFPHKSKRIFMPAMGLSNADLLGPQILLPIGPFNIFGCQKSTDIDIVMLVPHRDQVKMKPDMKDLREKLNSLGYDPSREIDLNLIYVEDGAIQAAKHGGKETQNIVLHTYRFHKQMHPCLITKEAEILIEDKIRIITKYVLDKLDVLLHDEKVYKIERSNKQKLYRSQNSWERIDYVISILKRMKFIPDDPKWKDVMKSLVMKLIQLLLLDNGDLEYTKKGLADKFGLLFKKEHAHALWFLMRGNEGIYGESCMGVLIDEFVRIVGECKDEFKWQSVPLELKINPTRLPQEVFDGFVSSPIVASKILVEYFQKACPDKGIGKMFILKCFGSEKLPRDLLENNIVLLDQRSPEWLEALSYYRCGKNTGVLPYEGPDWVEFYFNLVRGCFVEFMVVHGVDFTKLDPSLVNAEKVMVGLCVIEKKEKTPGIAPDLLLVVGDEIIPVEIKCVVGQPGKGHAYRRAVKLARLQLKSTSAILHKGNRGIIIIVYLYPNDDGNIIFDPQASIFSLS
ncbi:MAG: hypothetical protein Hyperionvirus13_8 [Hyperionvirus sp.]|uniref:Uncharacterized protein n=1 Tax=Hyperionvirus sp. TaxID=2487770 RepID=A0A3G5A9B1_9VIRU|nr:MAG: hypothetical protein Hyperionvirus13_8 [Hyperionvirus sp.]